MKNCMKKFTGVIAAAMLVLGMAACSTDADNGSESKKGTASQGTVVKTGLTIDGTTYEKTSEVCVVPVGTTAAVEMTDNSSWDSFVASTVTNSRLKGVFLKDRKVKLSPFVMAQYPVTRDLYKAVMGEDPSTAAADSDETKGTNPVNYVNWFNAIIFCNKLSALEGLNPVYSYTISGADETDPAKWIAATETLGAVPTSDSSTNYKNWRDNVKIDITKNGYRLPTEAEWEFAARGGDTTKPEWKYAFSGVQTKDGAKIYDGSNYLSTDDNLAVYGWYSGNANSTTHAVGTKEGNRLNIYDMSGNVWEWCNDFYNSDATTNDSTYTSNGYVTDPLGAGIGSYRVLRGGGWYYNAYFCSVADRNCNDPYYRSDVFGFRLVRSSSN